MEDLGEDARQLGVANEAPPGEGLVEDRPEGVEVAPGIDRLTPHLLGRHVGRRSDDDPGLGELTVGRPRLGDAEVEHLCLEAGSVRDEEDVVGLDVAVDDAGAVGGVERPADVAGEQGDLSGSPRAESVDHVGEAHPGEVLHDEEGRAVVQLSRVEDRDDAGVVDLRDDPRLPLESQPRAGVAEPVGADQLEDDVAPEPLVAGEEDGPHSPSPSQRRRR